MKRFLTITFVCLIVLSAMFVLMMQRMQKEEPKSDLAMLPSAVLQIGDTGHLIVELATTAAEQEQGLSDRAFLANDRGMFFLMGESKAQTFWMNRMHFPLDIIFINNGAVTDIHSNVLAPEQTAGIPAVIRSNGDADQVLEINAGKAKEWGIEKGTKMTLISSD